jgi:DNA invertase Pin-like site-specific DNA recombinase
MNIGYARVSTQDQNLALQVDALKIEKCEIIFKEKKSGALKNRPVLDSCLSHLRSGDTLIVWKLDRLGRTLKQLLEFIDFLKKKNIQFKSVKDNIDTSSVTGEFFFHIMASFAQLERSLIIERTQAGLAAARARGRKGGRPQTIKDSKKELAVKLYNERDKTVKEICDELSMSPMTFYRYLNKLKIK